jgi:phenylalanyl-tRNA synthetase beta chain
MKISVNWIKQFTDINYSVDELVTRIGAQLGAVEEIVLLGERYEGVVVAKIVSIKKHANADKLNVCKIDDAGVIKNVERDKEGLVQVVCGAPNVREGMLVAWIPPGNVVPSTWETDKFTLEAREIRGVVSNGMLASGKELAINDDHEGILEVDVDCLPGKAFSDVYQLNDVIIDIENKMFTHRPDCFGMLGVARELAGIQDMQFRSPDWYTDALKLPASQTKLPLKVVNKADDLVPRFMAQAVADVQVAPSSISVQSYLTRVGLKPINNVVDVTNLVMLLTAQPMHAYDYDKVKKLSSGEPVLMTREAEKGDKLELLNGKTQEFAAPAVMIATDQYPIGVGGVMGGAETEVDMNTKNIILECANFDMYNIRRTSMKYGLFTDAVTRFNKGQSVLQTDKIMAYATEMIIDVTNGVVASELHDKHNKLPSLNKVIVNPQFISDRLGKNIPKNRIATLLGNVEFELSAKGQNLVVEPPFWRTDIEIPEDIVEEVGRLLGYDSLPLSLPARDLTPTKRNARIAFKQRIRGILAQAGANELLTYNFVHGDVLTKSGQDPKQAYKLSNALSPELQYFRMSITPSLLDKVHANQKAGFSEFALFEINKAHNKQHPKDGKENVPQEFDLLAMTYAASDKAAAQYEGAPFYAVRQFLEFLGEKLGIEFVYLPINKDLKFPVAQPFDLDRSALVGVVGSTEIMGMVGEYRAEVRRAFKLPAFAAGFELGISELQTVTPELRSIQQLSRFPSSEQDITFAVNDISYGDLQQAMTQSLERSCLEHGYEFQVLPLGAFQKDAKAKRHISFRIQLTHFERTLTTDEVNNLLEALSADLLKAVKAERA